jgi:gluconolactonase
LGQGTKDPINHTFKNETMTLKKTSWLGILFTMTCLVACKEIPKEEKSNGSDITAAFSIEVLDDAALSIIDPNATIEIVASGFKWTEGPLWVPSGNYLLFSDIPNNKVFKWDSRNDTASFLEPSGFTGGNFEGAEPGSNGLLLNPNGELVLMQHGDRRVAKMNATLENPRPNFITLVDRYEGKRLNSPNDGIFDKAGNLYFTDPPYGLPKGMDDPNKELDFQGVYCFLVSGELVLIDKLSRPNGIAFSPDQNTLYVAVSDPEHAVWYAYDLIAPGQVENKRLFHEVTDWVGKPDEPGLPDGMKVNGKGYLFATGPGGIWIFDPNGKAMARIHTGQATANCAFTPDQKTLFMTADDYLLKVKLK